MLKTNKKALNEIYKALGVTDFESAMYMIGKLEDDNVKLEAENGDLKRIIDEFQNPDNWLTETDFGKVFWRGPKGGAPWTLGRDVYVKGD